ncbi:MAG: histidine--tRNA ligase [Akkermansiaceae bacterium]|nr:histidine--tRNA ligase [Akkermansiaceae bacterium]
MPDARFQPLTGFRDFAPQECAERNYLFSCWRRVAARYGFAEWEGPTVEATELYLKKTGGELPTQLFRFQDQGGRDVTLRPELTASLGRMAAGYQREYPKPLKWFEIGSCFRYEKPQKGRLREFYQFNADILGEKGSGADAELISLAIDCMRELGLTAGDFVVRISDRAVWLRYAAEHGIPEEKTGDFLAVVDKFERDSPETCQEKLAAFGLSRSELVEFIAHPPVDCSPRFNEVQADLAARGLAECIRLDLSVVRGLTYYTGLVFEIFDTAHSLRAIAGGGRYDALVGTLSEDAVNLPATGFAMGDAVIAHLIRQCPAAEAQMNAAARLRSCEAFLALADPARRPELLTLASALRNKGVSVDFPLSAAKLNNQLRRAERQGARYAVIVGSEYPALELKTLATRQSRQVTPEELLFLLSGKAARPSLPESETTQS